jgi:competence protein ComEA
MPEPDLRRIAAWVAAGVVLLAGAAWYLARGSAPPAPARASAAAVTVSRAAGSGRVVVDVAGAVRRPGVYRLPAGSRVEDALRRAGGPRRRADLAQINRAAKLEDGRQVLVPARPSAARVAAGGSGAAAGTATAATPAVPLNLNTATLEQLDELDGIGPTTAQKILDYRTEHGGFGSVDELDQVPGIGETRLAALRDLVRV